LSIRQITIVGTGLIGVWGFGASNSTGVMGNGLNGVVGTGASNGSGVIGTGGIGVWGKGSNYGVYSYGNFAVQAGYTKSGMAVLPDDRAVLLYSMESPENWYEDFGSGQLHDGIATIALEPTFAQTVSSQVGYHVFVTPNDECEGLYVTHKTPAGFEVHELRKGKSNVTFDYRIVAKRKGLESLRLEEVGRDHDKAEEMRRHLVERASHTPRFPDLAPPEAPNPPVPAAAPAVGVPKPPEPKLPAFPKPSQN